MDLALLWFGLVWAMLGGRNTTPETSPPSSRLPQPGPAAPWPAALPSGLPPFPGAGWEYDEPPPPPVIARARQLLGELWARGQGSYRQEQTAGRWIVYRAEITRGNKRGVVAYRERTGAPPQRRAPAPGAARAPGAAPAPAPARTVATILTSAGWPQPQAGGSVVQVVEGRRYQWSARVDVPAGAIPGGDQRAFAEGIARGLAIAGATNIAVSSTAPFVLGYQLLATKSITVPIGTPIPVEFGSIKCTITFFSVREIPPGKGPPIASTAPPRAWNVQVGPAQVYPEPESSPVSLPMLRRGMGASPGAPNEDVRTLQTRLGIDADGRFGPGTEKAVKAYQLAHGLKIDGVVGPETWTSLFSTRA
jgi:peptidoglycan hydrolase-like protein with peptidoglycan-binding domain